MKNIYCSSLTIDAGLVIFLHCFVCYCNLVLKDYNSVRIGDFIRLSSMEKDNRKEQFTELYKRESDAIFRFCLIRVSDREKALDLTSDTFMRFWDALSKKEENIIEHERAFLFKVARNLIIDWYRKKKSISLDTLLDEEDGVGEVLLLDKTTLNQERLGEARFVLDKIGELDPLYQQVIYMRFVEDMKPQEIAEILDTTVNAVSVRVHRGIEQLREITGYEIKS